MPDVNLNPFTAESPAIQRRLQMAQALAQQALQPMDLPQQAGVRASPYAGLAKILQAYNAAQAEKSATQEYKDLAERYQTGNRAEMGSFLEAMQGTPQKELAGPAPEGAPQGVSPEGVQGGYIQPAQAPDRQRAMALALGSQNPTLQGAGGALLSQMFAQDKIKDFKVELVGGKTHRIGYTETGKRTDLGEIEESVSPDTAARLKQDKEQADRAFGQLSASQKATLANDAARLNISAQQLFFDTGIKAGGGSFVNPLAQPPAPTTPPAQPTPNAPPIVPTQPNAQRPPVAGAVPTSAPVAPPVAGAPSAYTPLSQLSPKAQQQMAMEAMQAQQKKERGMQGIGETIDQAKNILQGKTFNEKGEQVKAPLPTQSYGGVATDFVSGIFGGSPKGSAEADRLKVLGGSLVMAMPRMEGPQSDRDVSLYREMAGQVGDSTLSVARRLAALDQVEKLYRKYDKTSVENLLEKYK
jgi:hypothetical protein